MFWPCTIAATWETAVKQAFFLHHLICLNTACNQRFSEQLKQHEGRDEIIAHELLMWLCGWHSAKVFTRKLKLIDYYMLVASRNKFLRNPSGAGCLAKIIRLLIENDIVLKPALISAYVFPFIFQQEIIFTAFKLGQLQNVRLFLFAMKIHKDKESAQAEDKKMHLEFEEPEKEEKYRSADTFEAAVIDSQYLLPMIFEFQEFGSLLDACNVNAELIKACNAFLSKYGPDVYSTYLLSLLMVKTSVFQTEKL